MPRATSTSTEEKAVKKAPRKRAAPKKPATATKRATPRKTTARKTTVKKTAARKSTKKTVEENELIDQPEVLDEIVEPEMQSTRKAPTKFAEANAVKKSKRNQYIVVALLLSIGVGASAAVGFSDSEAGQINVAQTIKERNERMANLVDVTGPTVVVPTPSQLPDGGLIGLRPSDSTTVPAETPSTASTTASSSDATATSTSNGATSTSTNASTTPVVDEALNQSATDTATTTVDAVETNTPDESTDNTL
jgi:hypothetical protein